MRVHTEKNEQKPKCLYYLLENSGSQNIFLSLKFIVAKYFWRFFLGYDFFLNIFREYESILKIFGHYSSSFFFVMRGWIIVCIIPQLVLKQSVRGITNKAEETNLMNNKTMTIFLESTSLSSQSQKTYSIYSIHTKQTNVFMKNNSSSEQLNHQNCYRITIIIHTKNHFRQKKFTGIW